MSSSAETARPAAAPPAARDGEDAAVAVVSLYAKQKKIYPRAVSGWFAGWRWALVWATQLVFYGLPWLQWNGRQAVLFDLGARRFYLFGVVLYPQDFIFLTGLLIVSAYSLFLFTAVAGRLWCGYACPQTVYTEIFMWIERKIQGDRIARMKLDEAPWSFDKAWRVAAKQAAWVAFALWTGFTFVGYFTPIKVLAAEVAGFGLGPWETFWILFYGLATYGNAGFLREQVCKYMCPYARFQGVMFDRDTLIITYDDERGEPRGSRPRKADRKAIGKGDCIDCGLCVQVCPTGIDIRKGLQYECIGCAACIDVCDGVMDKMGYPRGLIRYDTENGLAQHLSRGQEWRRVLRPRVIVYTLILLLLVAALGAGLVLRSPIRVDVVRDRASLARIVDDGYVENVYRLHLMNASEAPQRYRISAQGLPDLAVHGQVSAQAAPAEAVWVTVSARIPPQAAASAGPGVHPIAFDVEQLPARADEPPVRATSKSTFIVPR
ncbi:MAG: cytochrome c oxidase accessory protein CcoG [Burkholderiales bacterium]|nr:cytochrome c oxidase accessory protein CcoG [Burkholderiales bacterium]